MAGAKERLREARQSAGFASAKAAAETFGWPVATYIQHENGRRPFFDSETVERYAKRFRCSPQWLAFGGNEAPIERRVPSVQDLAEMLRIAQTDLPASTSFADWPLVVAATLHMLLAQYEAFGKFGSSLPAARIAQVGESRRPK